MRHSSRGPRLHRYGVWLLLIPRMFKPFYRGKIGGVGTVVPTTATMMSPSVKRTPTGNGSMARASAAPGPVTVVAPSPVPSQPGATPDPVRNPVLGGGVAAAARDSPVPVGGPSTLLQSVSVPRRLEFAGASTEDDAKGGVPDETGAAASDAQTSESAPSPTDVAPGDTSGTSGATAGNGAGATNVAAPSPAMDDMVPSARRVTTDWVSMLLACAASHSQTTDAAPGGCGSQVDDDESATVPSPMLDVPVVENHRLSRVELALQHSPTRTALCSCTVVAGLLVEVLELVVPGFPYALAWMAVLIPWGLAVAHDRHRGVYDSPFYVEMAMFAVMYVRTSCACPPPTHSSRWTLPRWRHAPQVCIIPRHTRLHRCAGQGGRHR